MSSRNRDVLQDAIRVLSSEENDSEGEERMRQAIHNTLNSPKTKLLLALTEENEIVGAASFRKNPARPFVQILHIGVKLPNKGIGKALLTEISNIASQGNYGLRLEPTISSAPFYVHLGFRQAPGGKFLTLSALKTKTLGTELGKTMD